MMVFLTQLVLGAKKYDPEGWMQILVFVAMVVVYALSGIFKAKGKKAKEEKGEQEPQQQPRVSRPVPRQQSRQGAQPRPRRIGPPQPAGRKLPAEASQPAWIPVAGPPAEPKLSTPTPQIQPEIPEVAIGAEKQKLSGLTSDTVREMGGKRVSREVSAKASVPKHLTKLLLDVSSPGEIRRAILHYEILGKPLSLRGPGEQIIGL